MNAFGNWTATDVLLHNQRVAGTGKGLGGDTTPARPSDDPESALHDFIQEFCRKRSWLAIHSRMDKPTTTALGVSDFIIVTTNTVYFIEAKRKGQKPTTKQRGFLTAVGALGWPQAIVHSKDEFLQYMEEQ